LTVNDQSLTEVLRKHIEKLNLDTAAVDPVRRADGSDGIVDMMLSRVLKQPDAEEREHLVVELKRPSQKITQKEVFQIQSYAVAVAEDERFRDTKTKWSFWLISNEMDDVVRRTAKQLNRPVGMLQEDGEGRFTIWVKTWGQIIRECSARHEFIKHVLGYSPDQTSAIEHLRTLHEKFLPPTFKPETSR
jgi:hypothetical protein